MPEAPFPPKARVHPLHRVMPMSSDGDAARTGTGSLAQRRGGAEETKRTGGGGSRRSLPFAELEVRSVFTFLTGASHPDELVQRAAELGHVAASIADVNTLAGVVRAHVAAKSVGIPLAVGARLVLTDPPGLTLLAHPCDRAAYGALSRLITVGRRRAPKGECDLRLHDVLEHVDGAGEGPGRGMHLTLIPPRILDDEAIAVAVGLRDHLKAHGADRLSLAIRRLHEAGDDDRLHQVMNLSRHLGVPLVATGDVHMHDPSRRPLQDVLTCIRHGCTLAEAGRRLFPSAERHLRDPATVARLLPMCHDAIRRGAEIALRAASFSLSELRYEYPDEVAPAGRSAMEHLRDLTLAGAKERFPAGVPEKVRGLIEHEFALIDELGYAPYFLTVQELCAFARSRGILHQGRGAAANSAVCYCLGVTAVDPSRIDMLFERFVSRERNEPPDIDIDFEHERREEVIQHIYQRYGRDRAALTAELITYRGRSAVRDVGKALGLSLDLVDRLARDLEWWDSGTINADRMRTLGLDPTDRTLKALAHLTQEILGMPRHLSQHVGGFVITRGPLCEIVPVQNAAMADRTVIEWDKDDIEAMNILKVDVLGLGMLTCIRKAIDIANAAAPDRTPLAFHTIPPEDAATYDMICAADTIGVFQIESRAQMSMLPRLKPRCFYDLVIEVALVRPGPIQGDMVHPYLRRRDRLEPVTFPDEAVRRVLERTLGVPLFQEQAMSLAVAAAGFTAGEADSLRRAIAAWKTRGNAISYFGERIVGGMIERGYGRQFAEQVFQQIRGFSGYGFPESHAASFALLVYVSAWLKRHRPEAFAAALINSQPMGFYAPAQIVRDAQNHGVTVLPVDVRHSDWDCSLEQTMVDGAPGLRLGLRLVKGLGEEAGRRIVDAMRREPGLRTIAGLWRNADVRVAALRRLAAADAFVSFGLSRQQALWAIGTLRDESSPLFESPRTVEVRESTTLLDDDPGQRDAETALLPPTTPFRTVARDYTTVGLTLRAHPMTFARPWLSRRGAIESSRLADEATMPEGTSVAVAGLVLVRQRPSTANGIVFFTIEDETGIANLIVRPKIYERHRRVARHSAALFVRGRVQRQGSVVHVIVRRIEPVPLGDVANPSRDFR